MISVSAIKSEANPIVNQFEMNRVINRWMSQVMNISSLIN